MANVLKHRFVSGKVNGPDATQVQPGNWNDGHSFVGGNAGDLLTRDPTDSNYGAKWTAAPAAVGTWVDVPYSAANFAGNGGSTIWTVQSADQITYCYSLVGPNLALVIFSFQSTDVTNSPGTPLQWVLPFFPTRGFECVNWASDNGNIVPLRCRIIAGDQVVRLYRLDGANWALSPGNTGVSGQLILRI